MAKNKGKQFEQVIRECCEKCRGISIDRLRDVVGKKHVDNPSDFIAYKYPYEYYLECKSHKGGTLPFSCIRENQIIEMAVKRTIPGVYCGLIIWYIDKDETWYVPIEVVLELQACKAKSIKLSELHNRWDCFMLPAKKKRVYFDYDMEVVLDQIIKISEVLHEQI